MRNYHDVTAIKLVTVSEPDSGNSQQYAMTIVANVTKQLDALSRGEYLKDIADPNSIEQIDLTSQQFYLNYYPSIKKLLGTETIDFRQLDLDLENLVGDGSCLFDVSALGKDLLANVFAVFLASGFKEIYYFKLLAPQLPKDRSKGRLDLIHNLTPREDYLFVNLAGGEPVRKALTKIRANLMQFRTAIAVTVLAAFIVLALQEVYKEVWALNLLSSISIVGAIASAIFLFVDPRNRSKPLRRLLSRLR